MLNLSGFVNIGKVEQQESSEDTILKGFVNNDLEKAKAVIGEIRNWGGVEYRKIANGEWVKVVKDKEKKVAESGIKKVISEEINKKSSELNSIRNKFSENWLKENNANLSKITDRVKLARALAENKEIKELNDKYYKELNDLKEDLAEVNNLISLKQKQKREELVGKKEISTEDDYFKENFNAFQKIFKDYESVKDRLPASEVSPKVNVDDYWLCTDADFKTVYEYKQEDADDKTNNSWKDPVAIKWQEMKDSGKYEFTQSPKSSSQYLIDRKTGDIYRMADHWGQCASCAWGVDFKGNYGIGVCNVKDFKRNDHTNWLNPEKNSIVIAGSKTILSKLKEMVTNDKIYFDKSAMGSIKIISTRVEHDLHLNTNLNNEEILEIKKQYKELFSI